MTDISKLKGITSQAAKELRDNNINTIEELWNRIGEDTNGGIDQVASLAGVRSNELIRLLAEQDVYGGGRGRFPKLDYVLILIVLILMVLTFAYLVWQAVLVAFKPIDQVVVTADADLPARRMIGPGDVTLKKLPRESGSFQQLENVIGHYPLEMIPKNGIVRRDQISEAHLSLAEVEDRHLLAVPIKAQALSSTVRPAERVSLLMSPRSSGDETPPAVIEDDAIVWAVTKSSDMASITVAVPQDDLEVMKSLLGISDVFVVQPSLENSPPAVVGDAKDTSGTEGALLKTSGAFSDPNDVDSLTLNAKNTVGNFADNGDGTWSWTLRTEDDVARAANKVIATDSEGATASDSFDFMAVNAPPEATFNYPSRAIDTSSDGFTLSLSNPSDPSVRDTFEYRFDCGEGAYGNWGSASSARCYADGGGKTLSVRAQIRDDDGRVSKEYTGSVQVHKAPRSPIPEDNGYTRTGGFYKPPVLTSAESSSNGGTTVKGHLVTAPKQICTLRFFAKGGSTNGAKVFIGKKSIVAGTDGDSSFTFSTRARLARKTITAMSTNTQGNASEFSAPRAVTASTNSWGLSSPEPPR